MSARASFLSFSCVLLHEPSRDGSWQAQMRAGTFAPNTQEN